MPLFIDGSKDGTRVASAACCRGYTESESLPGPASVYTAEIIALLPCQCSLWMCPLCQQPQWI